MNDMNGLRELLGINRHIFYYTSLESLSGIFPLNDSQINLFASHYKYLNDKEEIAFGKKVIRDIQKTAGKRINPFDPLKEAYILSFSQNSDSLPMWSMYGKNGGGVMLSLDANEIMKHDILRKCYYYDDNKGNNPDDELYKLEKDYQKYVSEFNQGLTQSSDKTNWEIRFDILPYIIKGDYFRYEDEVRIIEDHIRMYGYTVLYRFGKNGYIPYVVKKFPKEALDSIMVGPIANSRMMIEKIKLHLQKFGCDNVNVKISRIPYRG
jgi:hypothetical protein